MIIDAERSHQVISGHDILRNVQPANRYTPEQVFQHHITRGKDTGIEIDLSSKSGYPFWCPCWAQRPPAIPQKINVIHES